MDQRAIIESLRVKVGRLIGENERLKGECDASSVERDTLRAENRELKLSASALEKRIAMLELGGSLAGGSADTKQARARINRLMREIDRCIALMNK